MPPRGRTTRRPPARARCTRGRRWSRPPRFRLRRSRRIPQGPGRLPAPGRRGGELWVQGASAVLRVRGATCPHHSRRRVAESGRCEPQASAPAGVQAPRRAPCRAGCGAGTRPSPDDMQAPRLARFHAESAGGPGRNLVSPLYIAVCRKHGAPLCPELCTHSNQPPAYKGVRILGAAAGERQKTSPQQRKHRTDMRLKPKGPRLCHVY